MSDQEPEVEDGPAGQTTVEQIVPQVLATLRDEIDGMITTYRDECTAALETATAGAAAQVEAKGTELVGNLTALVAEATAHESAIDKTKATAEQTLAQIETLSTQSTTALDTTNTNRDTVVSLGERADDLNAEITKLQKQVRAAGESAKEHEENWTKEYQGLFEKIEGLLPGATGAGLASGFRDEKDKYETKQKTATHWFIAFLVLLVVTIAFAPLKMLLGVPSVENSLEIGNILRSLFLNLPLVAPAAWGAWWFNRKAHIYDRLGEEYRQKETLSNAFIGYIKQLKEVEDTEVLEEYLTRTLRAICVPAGRIYDKKSPGSPLEETLDKILDVVKKDTKGSE